MLLRSVSTISIAAMLAPASLLAQEDGARRVGIEEIVVTAAKRQSSLQDTAFAISAFEGQALEDRGIDDMANLQAYVPGLHVGQEQDGFKVSLRGIGLQGTSSISDPGVAFYIDNFYVPRPAGGSAIFYDIDRIEVLRGPQGTLYGRNATGGVVNVISNQPVFDHEAKIGASVGSRDLLEVRGVANVPLSDSIATRFSVVRTEEDGYVDNIYPTGEADDPLGTDGDLTARGQLLFHGADALTVLASATYSKLEGTGVPYHFLERNIGGPPPTQALLATLPPDPVQPLTVENDAYAFNDTETISAFVRVEKSLGDIDMFLQAGRFRQETRIEQDFDGSPVDVSIFNKNQDNDADSIEFRVSSAGAGPLEWILGAYYFAEDTFVFRRVRLNGLTPGGVINLPDFLLNEHGDSSTIAAFGNAAWSLTDRLRLTGGIRYTADTKEGSLYNPSNFGLPTRPDLVDVEEDFEKVTWKAGLEWDASDVSLAYFNVSSGYKAGGFNITSNGAPYDEENVVAYELGLKSNPFAGRAQFNVDAFFYSYDDMQLTTLTTINNAPGQFTTNAAESTIYGVEIDSQLELADSLLATVTYAYVNTEFDEYYNTDPREPAPVFNPNDPEGLGRENLSGNMVPYVPVHTVTGGLQYGFDVAGNSVIAAVNTSWHSEMFLREYNHPVIDRVDSSTKTDVTVTCYLSDSGFSITGYATNLEDDVEKNNIYISPGFIGASATTAYSRPRTYGIKVDFEY